MQIHVRGEHIEITEALREYAQKKIGRLDKYFDVSSSHDVHVTLSVVRDRHTVEVTMHLAGVLLRAEEKSEDMYASIDLVSDKLEKQIIRHRTKVNGRMRRHGTRAVFKDAGLGQTYTLDDGEVVRIKKFPMKPMPVEEAILQMDLLGHEFFVFSNAETESVSVVYKRRDGHYGLIEQAAY